MFPSVAHLAHHEIDAGLLPCKRDAPAPSQDRYTVQRGPGELGPKLGTGVDTIIVLRSGGTRAAAFGIHGATAVILLATSAALLAA